MNEKDALVLVVEDEPQMQRFLRASLTSHGFRLLEASTGASAVVEATTHNPNLVLLDLGLPDVDGIELTRRLREWSRVPIIVISARGREEDKVEALDAGADDYLTKPFGVNELLARIRVAFRHAEQASSDKPTPIIDIGSLHLDLDRREVTVDGREVHLTPIEYKLLVLLAKNAGKVLTHRQILKEVWGPAYAGQSHYVRVRMAELRKKIETDAGRPKLFVTEPGVGYRIRADASP
ncbi:MAG TPA: response regulator [Polyangiaceae bacterium]|jgi:two-component system KDP operon response regulator KdpE|nr:response regulator [Polyangiaceae bacterium]